MRIDKYLHDQQFGTRSQIHALIKQRRVILNHQIVKSFKQGVDPQQDQVAVDDQPVKNQTKFYYLLNKPAAVITATTDASQTTVMDLLAQADYRTDLFPVGRLDKDTTGAILLTNDGQLAHQLVSPKTHVTKIYEARVTGTLSIKISYNCSRPELSLKMVIMSMRTRLASLPKMIRKLGYSCSFIRASITKSSVCLVPWASA